MDRQPVQRRKTRGPRLVRSTAYAAATGHRLDRLGLSANGYALGRGRLF